MPNSRGFASITGEKAGEQATHTGPCLKDLDLICFSHLRWDLVFQRPQHLLTRAGASQRVYYVEEPIEAPGEARLEMPPRDRGVQRVIPHLPAGLSQEAARQQLQHLVDRLILQEGIADFIAWYYTPMALSFTGHLEPRLTVYDCMDELSHFRGAAAGLPALESRLFRKADVVFTGGYSLYRAKRDRHPNVHAFPSSIDAEHFARASQDLEEPGDQAQIPGPRIGYYGVIDERTDIALLGRLADLRPGWQFIMVGPVVKIDPADLPVRPNIHYLGNRAYSQLPAYLAGWDVAMMPFALNDATRFISPTKTLEYLAARKPVVSTAITDVVHPYGKAGLVGIASSAEEFVQLCEEAQTLSTRSDWQQAVTTLLASTSWDRTWSQMSEQLEMALIQVTAAGTAVQHGV